MVSNINITEFIERLNKNTKLGNPKIKGTPFAVISISGETNKPFFGTFDKTKFELTENATLFPTPFTFSGEINPKSDTQTEINYEVKPIGFGYYWLKYMPIIGILVFNLILYTESAPLKVYLIINPIMFSFIVFSRFYMWQKKNKLVNDFKRIFEID
ncbi:hypothetical protein [Flavobacterium helocola]|jgi:hypothetical protein|uniref:Fis family transcriptional regulator n=1 Tax=Flavobacterium helocola TaxID=3139139 RepID=A0ABU9I541_9FLAO